MAAIREIKTELRHREWREQIQECQNSGQTVTEWCSSNGIKLSTYYTRLRKVREELLSQQPGLQKIVPVSVSTELSDNNVVLQKETASLEVPLELRRKQVKSVIEEFYEFIGSLSPGKGSHLYEAVNYAQNQKKELMVFLDYPMVEMTNNLAERTVKPFVINRKNFLFSDTEKGANTKNLSS